MKTTQDIRLENINALLSYVSRTWLSDTTGVEYNQLNQYLGKSSKKNMGGVFSARISQGLGLPSGWLDTAHNKYEILNALGLGLNQDSSLINSNSLYEIISQHGVPFCDLNENSPLAAIETEALIKVRTLFPSYVFFRLACSALKGLFRNGIICCSGELVPGSHSIFLFKDGTALFAEYIYEMDGYVNLVDDSGVRKDFCNKDFIYSSKIALVLQ